MAASKVVMRFTVAPEDLSRALTELETAFQLTEDQLQVEGRVEGAPSRALKDAFRDAAQAHLLEAGIPSEWAGGFIVAADADVPRQRRDGVETVNEPTPGESRKAHGRP